MLNGRSSQTAQLSITPQPPPAPSVEKAVGPTMVSVVTSEPTETIVEASHMRAGEINWALCLAWTLWSKRPAPVLQCSIFIHDQMKKRSPPLSQTPQLLNSHNFLIP